MSIRIWFAVLALAISSTGTPAVLTQTQLEQLGNGASANVIVIMRDQLPSMAPKRTAFAARAAALSASHGSVMAELQRAGATKIREFSTINAIATTIPKSELRALVADSAVQAVIEDRSHPQKSCFSTADGRACRQKCTLFCK